MDNDDKLILYCVIICVICLTIICIVSSCIEYDKEIKLREYDYQIEQLKTYGEEMNYKE